MAHKLKDINQQVVVITGASSGIGLATARAASMHGATVVLAARSEEALAGVVADIIADGGNASYVVADVSNRSDVEEIARVAIERHGRIDTWVNDAGVSIYGKLAEVSEQDSRRLFDINFWGVVNGSLIALPHLIASQGALINLGSEVSDAVMPLQGMYAASKHAVKGFTDALRVEVQLADKMPISITLIQPTAVDTPFPQHAKNYLQNEPKLPPMMIDPYRVASAIIDAATSPTHDIKVGLTSKLNTTMEKLMPTIAESMAAKLIDKQHYDEPPRNPDGALYRPGGRGEIHGSGGVEKH